MKTFKGLPVCQKHGITYTFKDGCCRICKSEKKPRKLDSILKEMEESGILPKTKVMCHFCEKNEALDGDTYMFQPICHECITDKSKNYREQQDDANSDNNN